MTPRAKVIQLAKKRGLISASDLKPLGISRNLLYALCNEGMLARVGVGSYALASADPHPYDSLVEISRRSPQAVISLVSALAFHELTTQIPFQVWITLPKGAWVPKIDYPPVVATHVSEKAYGYGIEKHKVSGRTIRVYSPAKTVADCFKFRRKVGQDVALEALKDVLAQRKATPGELMAAAKVNRMAQVMRPYLEALV